MLALLLACAGGKSEPAPAGVTVLSSVRGVQGLEFDTVILPDATALSYPDTPADRRALYVALTRARRAVTLMAVGAPTTLLPS